MIESTTTTWSILCPICGLVETKSTTARQARYAGNKHAQKTHDDPVYSVHQHSDKRVVQLVISTLEKTLSAPYIGTCETGSYALESCMVDGVESAGNNTQEKGNNAMQEHHGRTTDKARRQTRRTNRYASVKIDAIPIEENAWNLAMLVQSDVAEIARKRAAKLPTIVDENEITQEAMVAIASDKSALAAIAESLTGKPGNLASILNKKVRQATSYVLRSERLTPSRRDADLILNRQVADRVDNEGTFTPLIVNVPLRVAKVDPATIDGKMVKDASWTETRIPVAIASNIGLAESVVTPSGTEILHYRNIFRGRSVSEIAYVIQALNSDGFCQPINKDTTSQYGFRRNEKLHPVKEYDTGTRTVRRFVGTESGESDVHWNTDMTAGHRQHYYESVRIMEKGETRQVRDKSLEQIMDEPSRYDSLTAKLAADAFPSADYCATLTSQIVDKRVFRDLLQAELTTSLNESPNAGVRQVMERLDDLDDRITYPAPTVVSMAKDALGKARTLQEKADSLEVEYERMTKSVKASTENIRKLASTARIASSDAAKQWRTADLFVWVALTLAKQGYVNIVDLLMASTFTFGADDSKHTTESRDLGSDIDLASVLMLLGFTGDHKGIQQGRTYRAFKPTVVDAIDRVMDRMVDHSDRADRSGVDRYEKVVGILNHLGYSNLHRSTIQEWRDRNGIESLPTKEVKSEWKLPYNAIQRAAAESTAEWQAIAFLLSLSSTTC